MPRTVNQHRPRILILVPHEPDLDPRVGWVADLCAALGKTSMLGATWSIDRPMRSYRGDVYIERVSIAELASGRTKTLSRIGSGLEAAPFVASYSKRRGAGRLDGHTFTRVPASLARTTAAWSHYWMIVDALYRRARSESLMPDLIVCHDLLALIAAVRLKRSWDVPILYDTHEYWPQADLVYESWEESMLTRIEGRLVLETDQVVTVSPPLAAHLERKYGLDGVLSVPNAVPRTTTGAVERSPDPKLRFLLQGQLAAGRGIELLLQAWTRVDDGAVLQLRYVPNAYGSMLETRYADLIAAGHVEILPPVGESELVGAAAAADVGVVPYVGPNLNHVFACPNKVSQYMQAGLALLASSDLLYVGDLVQRFGCGVTFDPRRPETLRAAVDSLVQNPDELARMKRASAEATRTEFNWEVLSRPYVAAIERLLDARGSRSEAA
jgi:glycosyltransferase involved in cell wall biosynthesis